MILSLAYLGLATLTGYGLWKYNEPQERKFKKLFENNIKIYYMTKKVCTYFGAYPPYEIELTRLGTKITLDIAGICSPKDIERDLDYIQALFRAEDVRMSYADGKVILDIQVFEDDNEQSQPIGKDPLMLPVGFDEESKDIFVDMHRNAGLLINGVPGVGKSVLIKQLNEYVVRNGAKCYYIQLAKSDLKTLGVEVADNTKDIITLTENLLELIQGGENKEIIYIFIDEFSFLTPFKGDELKADKEKIINNISMILRICRSEKVRVVLSTQKVISDFLPTSISSMLEAKMTFKCSDNSSSIAVIGTGEATKLKFREFILSDTTGIREGKTYSI